ncbi:unnamed protein product [Darwinula stevensoni]|uniref:Peptidase S1 domain-containing protein n=1 Tax=Darwinula stevensoni TaxID=69355 RepID=A0A7R8XBD5_9CRUS|nr:unnamed protein product [Darwinula stevensoni]CAG0891476.1 unnamed protein product [Darwinula stevensoni]
MQLLLASVALLCPFQALAECPQPPPSTAYTWMACGSKAGKVTRAENWIDDFEDDGGGRERSENRPAWGYYGYGYYGYRGYYGYGGYYHGGYGYGHKFQNSFMRAFDWVMNLAGSFFGSNARRLQAVSHQADGPVPELDALVLGAGGQGGRMAVERGEAPFNVMLYVYCPSEGWRTCSGSVINEGNVLTAAHCLTDAAGECTGGYVISGRSRDGSGETKRFGFSGRPGDGNDIGIVYPEQALTLGDYLQPVCIPDVDSAAIDECSNSVYSWESSSSPDPVLTATDVKVDGTCSRIAGLLDPRLCVQDVQGGRQMCQGGGGDPLVTAYDGKYYQTGIASSCGDERAPFTRVSRHADWIKANLK